MCENDYILFPYGNFSFGNFGLEVEICTVFTYLFRFLFLLGEKVFIFIFNMRKLSGAQGSRKGILLERPLPCECLSGFSVYL